jgi:hypothetical protein
MERKKSAFGGRCFVKTIYAAQEFQRIDLTGEELEGICSVCRRLGVRHDSGFLAVRCMHTERAAWRAPGGAWHLVPPMSKEKFMKAITRGIFKAELIADVFDTVAATKH